MRRSATTAALALALTAVFSPGGVAGQSAHEAASHAVVPVLQHADSLVGSDRIEDALAALEADLPRPTVEFSVLLPYERGDLINRLHQEGEIARMEHTGDGSLVSGRANADLAGELEPYAV